MTPNEAVRRVGARAKTRRDALAALAGLSLVGITLPSQAKASLALVYDATRFKVAPPRLLSAFAEVELYHGPRAAPRGLVLPQGLEPIRYGGVDELARLIADRKVAIALARSADCAALLADPALTIAATA